MEYFLGQILAAADAHDQRNAADLEHADLHDKRFQIALFATVLEGLTSLPPAERLAGWERMKAALASLPVEENA